MDIKKIGAFLKQIRTEKGLTQTELADVIGSTNKTISRWETGQYMPPVEMLLALSDFYNVSINEILMGRRLDKDEDKNATETLLLDAISDSKYIAKYKEYKEVKKWLKKHKAEMIVETILIIICINLYINLDISFDKFFGLFILLASLATLVIIYRIRIHVYINHVLYKKRKKSNKRNRDEISKKKEKNNLEHHS